MRLIYLASVPWSSFSQRPHELIRYFHSVTRGDVLWIDPYPGRFPSISDLLHPRPKTNGTNYDIPPWLTVVQARALPIEPLPFSGSINRLLWHEAESAIDSYIDDTTVLGIGKPTTLALRLLSRLRFNWSFYDIMDDNPAFYSGWSRLAMENRERRLIGRVATILASSSHLQDRALPLAQDVRLVLNACAADRMPEIPESRLTSRNQPYVIGYVGTIGHWFDWDLAFALAQSHPEITFRLIGPLYAPPRAVLPGNIHLEPALPHAEALQAMARFNVGLIPFKRNTLTFSVDPIKYYEYCALGLPVVSSAFGEMALRGRLEGVYLIDQKSDVGKVIDRALAYRANLEHVVRFRKDNSWKKRFDQADIFKTGVNETEETTNEPLSMRH